MLNPSIQSIPAWQTGVEGEACSTCYKEPEEALTKASILGRRTARMQREGSQVGAVEGGATEVGITICFQEVVTAHHSGGMGLAEVGLVVSAGCQTGPRWGGNKSCVR